MNRLFIFLALVALLTGCTPHGRTPEAQLTPTTGIRGQVADYSGRAVSGVSVYAYRNTSTSLRGPADFGTHTDKKGEYFLDLVEGDYFLIARWRHDGGEAGPPRAGDAWALPAKNPIRVAKNRVSRADFTLQRVKPGQPVLLRSGNFSPGKTGFTGRLVDVEGHPLPGAFALAYRDSDFRRRADYTSALVGSNGRFKLYLPTGGRYCLAARTRTRGQPIAGEPYGLLGEGDTGCRIAIPNKLIDVGTIHLSPYSR